MVRRRTRTRKKPAGWLGEPPPKRSGAWVLLVLAGLVLVNLYVFVWDKKTSIASMREQANDAKPMEVPSERLTENFTPPPSQPETVKHASGDDKHPAPLPAGTIEGKVAKGATLGKLLKKNGLSAGETDEILHAISAFYDPKSLHAGQTYRIERSPDNHLRAFELIIAKNSSIRAERDATGKLVGRAILPKTKIEADAMQITIEKGSFTSSIKAAGGNAQLAELLATAFAYDLDVYNDLKDGDLFKVVVDKEIGEDGKLVRYKQLDAARFEGKAGTFDAYGWHGKMYTRDGEAVERTRMKTPFKYGKTKTGTAVWAVSDGTIVVRTGDVVILRHDGYDTAYMRLWKPAEHQTVGQKVDAGTVVGYVDGTQRDAHFGVKKDGDFIDASKLPSPRAHGVPSAERDAFRTEVGKLSALLDACRSDGSSSC